VSRRRAFTLLEVLVVLALTATLLVVLQRAIADALRARRVLGDDVLRRGAVRAVLVHLVREIGTAVPGTLRITRERDDSSTLEFAVDEPTPETVRYRLRHQRLERATALRFAIASDVGEATMLHGVRHLEVRGRDDTGWHDTWDDARPPALVAVGLELVSGERLATTLPMSAGGAP